MTCKVEIRKSGSRGSLVRDWVHLAACVFGPTSVGLKAPGPAPATTLPRSHGEEVKGGNTKQRLRWQIQQPSPLEG